MQLLAPLHGGLQRLVPPGRQPVPGHEQRKPVIEAVQQLRYAQRLRQLDRQRHPVQPGTSRATTGPVCPSSANPTSARRAWSANSATASDRPTSVVSPWRLAGS